MTILVIFIGFFCPPLTYLIRGRFFSFVFMSVFYVVTTYILGLFFLFLGCIIGIVFHFMWYALALKHRSDHVLLEAIKNANK